MPSENYTQLLDLAARLWRIDPEYWDIWGRKHITSDDTKRAILQGMGVRAETAESLRASIDAHHRKEWTRLAPPCLVVTQGAAVELPLHTPAELSHEIAIVEIREETGAAHALEFALGSYPECGAADLDGHRYVRKQVPLPANLPLGYHDAHIRLGGLRQVTRLIVAPARAYAHPALADGGKAAGIALALYGVRSARNWGCGDLRDLHGVVDWIADDAQASFIALNPLHAIYNRRPYNTSPYLPECIFYPNYLYLDVESIPDFQKSRRAQRLWSQAETQRQLALLRDSEYVEYEQVSAWKLRFLKLAFAGVSARIPGRFGARAGVPPVSGGRGRFAGTLRHVLRARRTPACAQSRICGPGPTGRRPTRTRDSAETQAFRKKHWRLVLFYCYVQWQLHLQLAAAQAYAAKEAWPSGCITIWRWPRTGSARTFGPSARSSCPVAASDRRRTTSPRRARIGASRRRPPKQHRENGYRLFTESIRKNCRHGGALRIDHVMRFFRLFWIPEGTDATGGAYVRDNYEDLIRILALESVRQQVVVIGEDLGTVEPFVRETLDRFGILSYRLFYFEKRADGKFKTYSEYPERALVSSTTHDLPTLAGFWTGEDIEARRRAGMFPDDAMYRCQVDERAVEKQKMLDLLHSLDLLPAYVPASAALLPEMTGELHNAVIGFLALTPSQLLAVNQEDLTKEIAQQNLPATTWQYPNWSRKMKFTLEQLRTEPVARDFVAMFRNWLVRSGRVNRT